MDEYKNEKDLTENTDERVVFDGFTPNNPEEDLGKKPNLNFDPTLDFSDSMEDQAFNGTENPENTEKPKKKKKEKEPKDIDDFKESKLQDFFHAVFKGFKKSNRKIGVIYDTIKGIIIVLVLFFLIIFFGSSIIHNLIRVVELSNEYDGKYKNLQTAGDGMINVYSEGNGERTIVILPQFGISNPVMQYKSFADVLSSSYRVVTVEPMGYGFGLSTKTERTNQNIIKELREGLKNAKIEGPYILLTFSNSSIYADYYAREYPEEVMGIISINPMFPEELDNENFKDDYLPNYISNVKFYSVISFSGVVRWMSYLKPETFDINLMKDNSSYGDKELEVYRYLLANKFLTSTQKKELNKLQKNMEGIKDYKYASDLTTLQVFTSDYIDETTKRTEEVGKYAMKLISNPDKQKVRSLDGELKDYLYNKDMTKQLKMIIATYY